MARGFESKDVEFQQAEAERASTRARSLTADERAMADRRRTLELALARARHELAATPSALRRDVLTRAVGDLEGQLQTVPVPR